MKNLIIAVSLLMISLTGADAKAHHKRHQVRDTAPVQAEVCMAQAIYHEARNESRQGQIAVGNVIMNRVRTNGYAKTVCGVVYERCQFAFTCRKHKSIDWTDNADLVALSKQIISGHHEDYSRGAISFNNRPFKNRGLVKTTKIGHHYFYRSYANLVGSKEI